jgi:hypothetical protein
MTMPFKERTVNNANAIRTPQAIPCPEATDLDPDYHPCMKTNRRAVLLITILGSSLAFMDGSIVNVALPTPQRAFHRNLLKNSFESRNASTIETPEISLRALRSFYGILTRFIFAPRDHLTFFNKFLEKSIAR